MMELRAAGALLLPVCGWLAGNAVQGRTEAHLTALQQTITLLQRIRQEIAYRRIDLQQLYRQLCREGLLPAGTEITLQQLPAPAALTSGEQTLFSECISGLGRTQAEQECSRLAYYIARFQDALQESRQAAQKQRGLPGRLGAATGAVLALMLF